MHRSDLARWSTSGWRHVRAVLTELSTGYIAQSTVEYALVGALVVIAAATALSFLGGELTNVFTNIGSTLQRASTTPH